MSLTAPAPGQPGSSIACTGTLITPLYVLTANHCVTNADFKNIIPDSIGWTQAATVTVQFGPNSTNGPTTSSSRTTLSCGGSACVRENHSVTIPDETPTDIAVYRLAAQMTPADLVNYNVVPVHPFELDRQGNQTAACDTVTNAFTGLFSGYAGTTQRLYGIHDIDCSNDDCASSWCFPNGYGGIESGDSGGPLYDSPSGLTHLVCGVASRHGFDVSPPFNCREALWARTNTSDNNAFIQNIAWDRTTGLWKGECVNDGDDDSDGVPNSCDNCQYDHNPRQENTDRDRWGDVCDNCLFEVNDGQEDGNISFESEAWLASDAPYPGRPLLVARTPSPLPAGQDHWSTLSNPRSQFDLTRTFPGLACDPQAKTFVQNGFSVYTDNTNTRTFDCTLAPGPGCSGPTRQLHGCTTDAQNVLDATSYVTNRNSDSRGVQRPIALAGATRALACRCAAQTDPQLCKLDCPRNNVAGQHAPDVWLPMTVADPAGNNSSPTYINYKLFFSHLRVNHPGWVPTLHRNDASGTNQWAWPYWLDIPGLPNINSLPPQNNPPPLEAFEGIIWTWVNAWDVVPGFPSVQPLDPPEGSQFEQVLRQNVAEFHIEEDINKNRHFSCNLPPIPPNIPLRPGTFPTTGAPPPTPRTPPGTGSPLVGFLYADDGSPKLSFFPVHGTPFSAEGAVDATVEQALSNPALQVIMGLDPTPPGTSSHGVIINVSDRNLVNVLRVDPTGRIGVEGKPGSVPTFDPPGRPVVEVSNRRQEVAFFDDRDGSSQLLPQVRLYDFTLQTTLIKKIIGETRLQGPIAAAYRSEDDTYYVLDRAVVSGRHVVRLVRIMPSFTAFVAAEWPDTRAFTSYGLGAGLDGTLLVTASTARHHVIARLNVDAEKPRLLGLFFGRDAITVPAWADHGSITFVRRTAAGADVADMIRLRSPHVPDGQGRSESERDDCEEERHEGEALNIADLRRMF